MTRYPRRALVRTMATTVRSRLRERIHEVGGFEAVAARLGCTSARLYQLVNDESGDEPSLEMAARIDSELGIAMAEWKIEAA